jgi:hypothetical protein
MRSRSRTRVAALAGVVALAALVLSACQKPTPLVAVQSGGATVHREAQCWAYPADGAVDPKTCRPEAGEAGQITVSEGQTIGISVDPSVADQGWFPLIDGARLVAQPLTTTYYRTALDNTQLQTVRLLTVTALASDGKSVRGVWSFILTPAR